LLAAGHEVLTLTNSVHRQNPFGDKVRVAAFNFDQPELLAQSLQGVDALINTYWVRFDHKLFTHEEAVDNSLILFDAAQQAGVRRIVHVSITNPDPNSDLPYFRGKAELESALQSSGLSYCILRPTVLFGKEDVLINNIAWALRRFPIFGVFGRGDYQLQPIYVDDLAAVAVQKAEKKDPQIVDAIGPETFTYRELVTAIATRIGVHRRITGVPPTFGYWACRLAGALVHDVIITREEIRGLMENRLFVASPPLGWTKLTDWVTKHAATLGLRYTSEMNRRLDRTAGYLSN
jgi:NADH dehydrogenase